MTTADFVAACFWPLVILFAALLGILRDPALRRFVGFFATLGGVGYVILWAAYGRSSVVAVVDLYLATVVLGFGAAGWGFREWYLYRSIPKSTSKACAAVLGGFAAIFLAGRILIQDFFEPPIVLEGRVQNLRETGSRQVEYSADVAGRRIKVTTPVYERLKFLPVVRVEVGRGSDYVYKIDYLAN